MRQMPGNNHQGSSALNCQVFLQSIAAHAFMTLVPWDANCCRQVQLCSCSPHFGDSTAGQIRVHPGGGTGMNGWFRPEWMGWYSLILRRFEEYFCLYMTQYDTIWHITRISESMGCVILCLYWIPNFDRCAETEQHKFKNTGSKTGGRHCYDHL
jgi:hypothetical protein